MNRGTKCVVMIGTAEIGGAILCDVLTRCGAAVREAVPAGISPWVKLV
jgi:hypothetical protein